MNALGEYAAVKNPGKQLSSSLRLSHTNSTITIFDAFPKARYHFLCLPRMPFPLNDGLSLQAADLGSVAAVLKLDRSTALQILTALQHAADEAVEMIQDEMLKTEGFMWEVYTGFHAIPSMPHLHLHVISSDLSSERLKTKHHYNSFRPDSGFFLHLRDVISWLAEDTGDSFVRAQISVSSIDNKSAIVKQPLSCFKCGQAFSTLPSLKGHLVAEWEKEKMNKMKESTTG